MRRRSEPARSRARAASAHETAGNTSPPTSVPATIVSGKPIPNKRAGTEYSRRNARKSIRDASVNSTTTSVASASVLTASWSSVRCSQPSPSVPNTNPATTNTIGAVIDVPCSRRDSAAYTRKTAATTTRLELSTPQHDTLRRIDRVATRSPTPTTGRAQITSTPTSRRRGLVRRDQLCSSRRASSISTMRHTWCSLSSSWQECASRSPTACRGSVVELFHRRSVDRDDPHRTAITATDRADRRPQSDGDLDVDALPVRMRRGIRGSVSYWPLVVANIVVGTVASLIPIPGGDTLVAAVGSRRRWSRSACPNPPRSRP